MKRASLLTLTLVLLVALTTFAACDQNDTDASTDAITTAVAEVTTTEPETTVTEPETTVTEPETTVTEPETTVTEPETTVTEPETNVTEPETTVTEPETTATEPEDTKPDPEQCTHSFGDWIVTFPANCKYEGKEIRTCSICTLEESNVIPTNEDHSVKIIPGVAPTCTTDGLTEGSFCSTCGRVFVGRITIPAAHTVTEDPGIPPTQTTPGLTEGSHCSVCGEVLVAQIVIPITEPQTFASGFITTEPTVIRTNHLELHIPANVYVPSDLVENLNIITAAMEQVSGLTFAGNPLYANGLLPVEVIKLENTERELGPAYATPSDVVVSSGDLVDLFAIIHECSHALQYRNSNWQYCQWAMEGISTYTTLKTQLYIQENYPNLVEQVGTVNGSYTNYEITDYSKLYEHDMVYWMTNTFEYSGNVNYSIGFRLMHYLEETYGDYTKWITLYESMNPYAGAENPGNLSTAEQIKAFETAYAEGVLDAFYTWLRPREAQFEGRHEINLREATSFNLYPTFAYDSSFMYLQSANYGLLYHDLYIGLDQMKFYLSEYKNRDISGLYFTISSGVTVALYDASGNLLRCVTTAAQNEDVDLTDASYIKLVGEGRLTYLHLNGYDKSVT